MSKPLDDRSNIAIYCKDGKYFAIKDVDSKLEGDKLIITANIAGDEQLAKQFLKAGVKAILTDMIGVYNIEEDTETYY